MKKVINVKPAVEIEIVDPISGKTWNGYFNMKCVMLFQEILKEKGITTAELSDKDLPAMCLYAVVNTTEYMAYEEAEALSMRMGPASGSEIVNLFMESIHETLSEDQKAMLKKEVARYVMRFQRK